MYGLILNNEQVLYIALVFYNINAMYNTCSLFSLYNQACLDAFVSVTLFLYLCKQMRKFRTFMSLQGQLVQKKQGYLFRYHSVSLFYEEGYSSKELVWRFCLLKFSVEHGVDLLTLIRTVEQRNEHNNGLHPCLPKVSLPRLLAGCPKCSRSNNG